MKKVLIALTILGSFYLGSCDSRKAETNDNSQNSATDLDSEGEADNEAGNVSGSTDPSATGSGTEGVTSDSTLNTDNTNTQ